MKNLLLFAMAATMLFAGCAKDGETGPKGDTGAAGTNGVANIQTDDFTIHPNEWSYNGTYQQWYNKHYITASYGTVVLAYVMSGNGKQALPYSEYITNTRVQFADNLFQNPSYIEFQFLNYNSLSTAPTSDKYIYLVLIPPARLAEHPGLDVTNYDEVKAAFHLTK